jgi:glutamine synthetase
MTPEDLQHLAREHAVEFVDLRFIEFPNHWRHLTVPVDDLTLQWIGKGFGFDSASLHDAGKVLVPVPETAFLDPFFQHPTLSVICDVREPVTGRELPLDPRGVAKRAEQRLRDSGVADSVLLGPELEFYIFDQASYEQGMAGAHHRVDSREGAWRRGRDEPDNVGTQIRPGEASCVLPPFDSMHNLRSEMVAALNACGIECTGHHHASATGGQSTIDLRPAGLVEMADKLVTAKNVIRNVAARHGKVATFMAKPLYGEAGSGLHTHLSLWKGGQPVLSGDNPAGLSDVGLWAVGGLLHHAPTLLAWACPTTNSYKRLVGGHAAPLRQVYTHHNPWGLVRVPLVRGDQAVNWLEFRAPDPTCNPYLAFAAIIQAVLDGIEQKRDPGPPIDHDLDELSPAEAARCAKLPCTLGGVMLHLEADGGYLQAGGVFSHELVSSWIGQKRATEIAALDARPHPYEFCLYFDA